MTTETDRADKTAEYTLDDLASDLRHLFDLVDTVVNSLVNNEFNRGASLAWIARDQLELIKDRVVQKNDAAAATPS
jgi:hypothetical protein